MHTNKVKILAFGAHPDVVECAAAGVLLKHIAIGKTVSIVYLTAGEMGSYGTAESRREEAEAAAKILRVQYREQWNITKQVEQKMEAILAFKSQFVHPEDNSANSMLGLLNQIKSMNSIYIRPINAVYADRFTANRYIGVPDLFQFQ